MNDKQKFFAMVDFKKEHEQALQEQWEMWNNHTCWYGTPEEVEEHYNRVASLCETIISATEELSHFRQNFSSYTLRQWRDEYNSH